MRVENTIEQGATRAAPELAANMCTLMSSLCDSNIQTLDLATNVFTAILVKNISEALRPESDPEQAFDQIFETVKDTAKQLYAAMQADKQDA